MKLLEFNKKFGTEEDCVQYLKERREQDGLVCSKCGGENNDEKFHCAWDSDLEMLVITLKEKTINPTI